MKPNKTLVMPEKPDYLRAAKSSGTEPQIDRTGGMYGAGIIRGVSVITEGEALGHGFWVDSEFNSQVSEAINQPNKGIKSRFTHPGLSGDGLGRHLGRITDARVEGNQVIADQHFSESAHSTPDGNLAAYLMDLASEDPAAYGLSIVFMHDEAASDAFTIENSEGDEFTSPDPNNIHNLPHSRLAELRAADAVDEPAANPNGLFHREQEIAQEANAVASYALGLSDEPPTVACLGIDAGRVKRFLAEYLDQNQLNIVKQEIAMSEEIKTEGNQEELASEAVLANEVPELATGQERTGQDYLDAFGDQGGVWFAEGKSFDMCLALQNKALREEVDSLKQLNSAPTETGEEAAVDFQAEESEKGKGFASKIKIK